MEKDINKIKYDLQRSYESDIGITKFTLNYINDLLKIIDMIKYVRVPLPRDTLMIAMCNEDFCRNFGNDFIPKSKIKEKLEEFKNGIYDAKIILQQLLDDELIEENENHIPFID